MKYKKIVFSRKLFPSNKRKFLKLLSFLKDVVDICREVNADPILYGSLSVFIYTKETSLKVNDVDLLLSEKYFIPLIKSLDSKNILYNYDPKWHVIQIFHHDLKIEIDSIEFWQENKKFDTTLVEIHKVTMKMLSLKNLKNVYKNASLKSKDNLIGNKNKLELLKNIKE